MPLPFAGAVAFAFAFAFAGAVAVAVAFAVAGAFAFAVAVAGAFAVAFAGALILVLLGDIEAAAAMALFTLLLPITNALADTLSVAATRAFLRWGATRRPLPMILGAVVLDIALGLLSLAVLLFLLTQTLDFWAAVSPETLPLDWRSFWQAALADPWQGTALWLMGFTTILPTLLHIALGLTALVTHGSRSRRQALLALDIDTAPTAPNATRIAKRLVSAKTWGLAVGFLGAGLVLAALLALALPFLQMPSGA